MNDICFCWSSFLLRQLSMNEKVKMLTLGLGLKRLVFLIIIIILYVKILNCSESTRDIYLQTQHYSHTHIILKKSVILLCQYILSMKHEVFKRQEIGEMRKDKKYKISFDVYNAFHRDNGR